MSLVLFQIDGNGKEIARVLQKYYGNCFEQHGKDAYINCTLAPDYCQLIGLSNRDTKELEKIAKLLSNPSGGKKIDAYNKKKIELQRKLNETKNSVSSNRAFNVSGMSVSNIDDLVNSIDKHIGGIQDDTKVKKAQQKLDKFENKKQTINNAQHYSVVSSANIGSGLISFGAGMQSQTNNIFELIDKVKKGDSDFVDSAYESFYNMVRELSGYATEIGVMPILDGVKKPDANNKKTVKLSELTAAELTNAKNRELYIIVSNK